MSAQEPKNSPNCSRGGPLNGADYEKLGRSWITKELADQVLLRRVSSGEGAEIVGRSDKQDYEGIIFPYVWPGEDRIREYWLRRDRPEIEHDAKGKPREKNKYLGPPGRGNLLYITPGTPAELIADVRVPIAITEGAKKTLALHRLSTHGVTDGLPRFFPVGLGGVWSFTGTIGKTVGMDGSRRDEKGLITDLRRLTWTKRRVYIVFDSNTRTNTKVAAARRQLTAALVDRGAEVYWVNLPRPQDAAGVNGVDDLIALWGPDRVLELFHGSEPAAVSEPTPSQSQELISLCDEVDLFHTPVGEAFAHVAVGDHRETWMLRSKGFQRWLARQFHLYSGKPPRAQSVQEALGVLEAKAQFESPEITVWIRVAEYAGRIYIDLCNAGWEVVVIEPNGWRIVTDHPVRFRRTKGMHPLPRPASGGSVTTLRSLINVGDDSNWVVCLCWLVAACRPKGPYPILILQGEQGSAKSTTARFLRRLIDPSISPVRTPPRDERDLLIAANNSWVIAYDNLSGIQQWLSDSLCRLATGGGFSTRELYTDSDEVFFDATRPVILNGIDHLAERADLADRAIILNLPRIEDEHRKDEAQLYADFEKNLPLILGAVFDAVSGALARSPSTKLSSMPRMADFAIWATAAEEALGFPAGAFMSAYSGNRSEAIHETLEADPVGGAILTLTGQLWLEEPAEPWNGTYQDLLNHLSQFVDDETKKSRSWPKNPRGLSGRLRRLVTFLRESQIGITFHPRGSKGQRSVTIARLVPHLTVTTVTSVTQNADTHETQADTEGTAGDGRASGVTVDSRVDRQPSPESYPANGLNGLAHGERVTEVTKVTVGCGGNSNGDSDDAETVTPVNVCPACGPIEWVWKDGAWVCPICGQPAVGKTYSRVADVQQ